MFYFHFLKGMLSVMCSCLSASFGLMLQLSTRFKLKIFTRRFILNFLCLAALIILKKMAPPIMGNKFLKQMGLQQI